MRRAGHSFQSVSPKGFWLRVADPRSRSAPPHQAMPPRRLRPTPSNSNDMGAFQKKLLADVKALDAELVDKRQPFQSVAASYVGRA